jgi:ribosomal protein S18 acetylase RimI-like enzyme
MLSEAIKSLVREEQARQNGCFIQDVDLDKYLAKLDDKAEIIADFIAERCRGFVAFYCNDPDTKTAYITLVLVHPLDRELGIGQALMAYVLSTAKRRGFRCCRLEVSKSNQTANNMYRSQGFRLVEEREKKYLLEVDL